MTNTPRLGINLSREPFRRDRPLLAASWALVGLLTTLLIFLISLIVDQRDAAADSRTRLAALEGERSQARAEMGKLDAYLRQPANVSLLESSSFFNTLLQRKGVSWTRLFSDLQDTFPANVRLVSVRPNLTADNKVQLDMVVGAQAPEAVFELLRRFERSPLFHSTTVQGEQPPTQNEPLYRFRLSVNYAQAL
jgi:type IV pilus assembly protein PilN